MANNSVKTARSPRNRYINAFLIECYGVTLLWLIFTSQMKSNIRFGFLVLNYPSCPVFISIKAIYKLMFWSDPKMTHDDVTSEILCQIWIPGTQLPLLSSFYIYKGSFSMNVLNWPKMTHNDVIDKFWYQIWTPGARISLQTELWPDWSNFKKRTYRKCAITGLKFKK